MHMSVMVLIIEVTTKKRRMSIQFSLGLNQSHELFTGLHSKMITSTKEI